MREDLRYKVSRVVILLSVYVVLKLQYYAIATICFCIVFEAKTHMLALLKSLLNITVHFLLAFFSKQKSNLFSTDYNIRKIDHGDLNDIIP